MPRKTLGKPRRKLSRDDLLLPFASTIRELEWFYQSSFVGVESNCLSDTPPTEPPPTLKAIRKHRKILRALSYLSTHDTRILEAAFDYFPWLNLHLQLTHHIGPLIGIIALTYDLSDLRTVLIRKGKAELTLLQDIARKDLINALKHYQTALDLASEDLDKYNKG